MRDICICILAYNEQKHIAETIKAIAQDCSSLNCEIKVYANGCTDNTVEIVKGLMPNLPNLHLRELDMASKINAWNVAFHENVNSVLVFSDGDVTPEAGAVEALWRLLTIEHPEIVLAGCSVWPRKAGLTLGQRIVGFLQIPLMQTFLAGGLYAVRRSEAVQVMQEIGIDSIPLGLVGEDVFLELLVPAEKFCILVHKFYYEPPNPADYLKYLARLRWQNEQLATLHGALFNVRRGSLKSYFDRLTEKAGDDFNINRLLLGCVTSGLRCVVKGLFRNRIIQHYRAMGPVNKEGGGVLGEASRSRSTK